MEFLVVDNNGALIGESNYISDALHIASKQGGTVVTYVEPQHAGDDCYPVTIARESE
jgi:hypothetical protein